MKQIISALFLLIAAGQLHCQTLRYDEKVYHWEGGAYLGLNTDGYEVDMGVSYFFNRFVGVRAGIGWAARFDGLDCLTVSFDPDDPLISYDPYDRYYDDSNHFSRFKFTPSLVLRTPCLIDWRSQEVQIYGFAEPGITLASPAPGTTDARWFNVQLRAGLNMQIDRWVVSLGYGISDFCLESGYRNKRDYLTHSVLVGVGWKF
ncbi:MAG: hypothetical protein K2O00_06560 [Muribaculaceae bacterium]|nr:hypothetical protein [Muribaculaceae bacterium]